MNTRRLYRCTHDRMLAGVASGVAEYFDVDPTVVRVIWALSVIFTGGLMLLLYIVMAIIVPLEPDGMPAPGPWQPGADQWGAPQWAPRSGYGGWPAGQQPTGAPGAPGAPAPGTPPPAAPGEPGSADENAPEGSTDPTGETGGAATDPGTGDPSTTTSQQAWNPYANANAYPYDYSQTWHARHERRRGNFSIYFGIILIMLGALALADAWLPVWGASHLWPLFIVGVGILFVIGAFRRHEERQ